MSNLNPYTRLASFYRYFYLTEKLPNNICSYTQKLIFAFIMLPFTWIAVLQNYLAKAVKPNVDYNGKQGFYVREDVVTAYGLAYSVGVLFIGIFITSLLDKLFLIDNKPFINNYITATIWLLLFYFLGIIYILLIVCFVYIIKHIVYGVVKIIDYINKDKPKPTNEEIISQWVKTNELKEAKRLKRESNPSLLRLMIKRLIAFKERNCELITWDYKYEKKDDKQK
jgi:hypothetical protein